MIEQHPTKNFWSGRRGYKPEAIVIHVTDGAFNGAVAWLLNPASQASAHYIIARTGQILQLVDERDTAWHCGILYEPIWRGIKAGINPNLYTIGIEHEGSKNQPMTIEQWTASTALIADIARRWEIPLDCDHIIGHNTITKRKSCPGLGIPIGANRFA